MLPLWIACVGVFGEQQGVPRAVYPYDYSKISPRFIQDHASKRPPRHVLTPDPVVAIGVATRSAAARLEDMSTYRTLVPSIVKKAEPGFRYWLYIVADRGDARALHLLRTRHPALRALETISSEAAAEAVRRDLPTLLRLPAGDGTARGKAAQHGVDYSAVSRPILLKVA